MKTEVKRLWNWWTDSWVAKYMMPRWVRKTIWDLVLYYHVREIIETGDGGANDGKDNW